MPGRGIERADLGQHVEQILLVDAADPLQRLEIAARQQVEIGDQRLASPDRAGRAGELQRQAFGEIAGEHAGRLEALADRQHRAHGLGVVPSRAAISAVSARI